jgi:osmotically-inducible protein OsmY
VTRPETVARTVHHDDVDVDAILGASLSEPDAPMKKTKRQGASAVPASREIELDAPVKSWREMFEDGLRMQVRAVLSDHELADVEISIDGARVELHGKVPDALTSQLVEDLAWSVPAVRQCDNHLRVAG